MNRIHHYQGLDSRQKSGQEATEPASTNNRFTRSLGKSRSSFNNSVSQSITNSIQKGKSSYLNHLEVYYNMHLIEILAELLKKFEELYQQMVDQLKDLLYLIKQVDFEATNFEELYQTDAEYFSETVYRDIKHLEQQHYDLIYSSSLRFLSNVLQCLQFNFEIDIYEFDIRDWAQQGLDHILKFSGLRRSFRQPISCCQKYCKCISNLLKNNRQRR